MDSLRLDRVGCFGSARPTTPNIDRFAAESARFSQVISPHIPTHPAHTSLFSGLDVFDHQIVAQGGHKDIDPSIRLLPELLRERGWLTAAVDNIGRWIEPAFEIYQETKRWNHDGLQPWRSGEEVNRLALPLLEQCVADGRPFFLFLHYWDPHTPYLPPAPFNRMFYNGDEKAVHHASMEAVWNSKWFANYFAEWLPGVRDIEFVKAQYDANVAYGDWCVGQLIEKLKDLDLFDSTLVLLHSDHGEELDDHGCWFDHHGLYDTVVSIPLVMRLPDRLGAGRHIASARSLLDIPATVCDAIGLPELAEPMAGRSLMPDLTAESDRSEEPMYLTECTWMRKRGWRTPKWKLIQALEPDIYGKPEIELYDLVVDSNETMNLADEHPDVVAELTEARDAYILQRVTETGKPDPLVEQADALRVWQPRFIAGRNAEEVNDE
jgi:arylsulfatase A-like enzyme